MSDIEQVLKIVLNYMAENKQFEKSLELNSSKAMQKVQHAVADSFSQGYCMLFAIPEPEVVSLFTSIPGIDAKVLHDAFVADWQLPNNALMLRNTYYHSAMLLFIYAVLAKKERLAENAIAFILFRMWNGRRHRYIKFCDPDTMAYVISNMMNKQYIPTKFNTPYEMIAAHFAKTMTKKYSSYIKRDIKLSKLVINQTHARIQQLFVSNAAPDLRTGKTKYVSGLAPLYFKAKEEGYKISSNRVYGKGEDGPTVDEIFSSHDYTIITDNTTHSIITNHSPKYKPHFEKFIANEAKAVNSKTINMIMYSFYTSKFKDHLGDIISLILKRLDAPKSVICSDKFMQSIKKIIISSKHNPEVTQIKGVADAVLSIVFATQPEVPVDYDRWSNMSKSQFRRILIYSIAYNIPLTICK